LFKSRYTIKESASNHRIRSHYAFVATDVHTIPGALGSLGRRSFKMSWNKLAQDFQQAYFFLNRNEPLGRKQLITSDFLQRTGLLHVGARARRLPFRFAR
jgi:hypothetical protein